VLRANHACANARAALRSRRPASARQRTFRAERGRSGCTGAGGGRTPDRRRRANARAAAHRRRLDDEAWADAPLLIDHFVQREPVEGAPSASARKCACSTTSRRCTSAPGSTTATRPASWSGEARRDADLTDADAFLLLFDTYLDRQNAFVFGTTPAGIEYDGQVTREGEGGAGAAVRQQAGAGGGFNKNWDGSWQVATSRDANGWYAEFRIPFSTLRYGGSGEQTGG
jgi:hypothetical protein